MAVPSRRKPAKVPSAKVDKNLAATGQGVPGDDQDDQEIDRGRPVWLRNLLTVSGPVGDVGRFREAARGTNGIPWPIDLEHEEMRLFAPMSAGTCRTPQRRPWPNACRSVCWFPRGAASMATRSWP